MVAESQTDAILIGGPRDQSHVDAGDAAVLHIQIDDLVHRYIRTNQDRTVAGESLVVYNYDGQERAEGGIR